MRLVGALTAVAIPFVFGATFRGVDAVLEVLHDGRSLLITVVLGCLSGVVGGVAFILVGSPFESPPRAR